MGIHYWVTEKDQSIKTKMVLMIGIPSLLSIFCITSAQNVGDSCEIAQDCYTQVCYYGKCQPDPTKGVVGSSCDIAQDCIYEVCRYGKCQPECEVDVDCGNSKICQNGRCEPIPTSGGNVGDSCDIAQDCNSGVCQYQRCQPDPTCGGKPGCSCDIAQDCVYEVCRYGKCQPECEVDVDCGN